MNVTVRDFLGASYNHGEHITVVDNKDICKVIWTGEFETPTDHIPWKVQDMNVVKWGIEKNGIVIYVDFRIEEK